MTMMVQRLSTLHDAAFDARQPPAPGGYHGLRATAEEFSRLPDDGAWYELIDGVIVMSPSPTPRHQLIAKVLLRQLDDYVERHRLGVVLHETDVHLSETLGRTVIYRPDVIFFVASRATQIAERVTIAPDLVVEVVSESSRGLDTGTKRVDYERAGVREYWIVDPAEDRFTFYRLAEGRFAAIPLTGERWRSEVVAGFELDVAPVRAAFRW